MDPRRSELVAVNFLKSGEVQGGGVRTFLCVVGNIIGKPFVAIGSCFVFVHVNVFVLHTSP